jgi:beta-mannosidase
MLSCNQYPDDDEYLEVLKKETVSIIRRLRTHPCLAFWCGGNELFNSWSDMTSQSHALRLIGALCYEHDRFTPYNMTSPLYGLYHGSYVKVVFSAEARRTGDYSKGHEFIRDLKTCRSTGYTEFGCNGASPKEYLLKYVMDEDTYNNCCDADNEIWREHHAFKAWQDASWLGIPEVDFYFGSHKDTDDIVEKSIYLQDMCYKSMFEEMRRQAPLCAMAINWDFNEPWPSAAGNSLVNWPAKPKSALYAVGQALRPTLLSLETSHNRYLSGETLYARVWVLNDSPDTALATRVSVYLIDGDNKTLLTTLDTQDVFPRQNGKFGTFTLNIDEDLSERFYISLECDTHKEWNSTYSLVHNRSKNACGSDEYVNGKSDDFSDFLK